MHMAYATSMVEEVKPACFAECTLNLAAEGRGRWTNDVSICPDPLSSELHVEPPPVVLALEDTIHPFCIASGYSLMRAFHVNNTYDERIRAKSVNIAGITLHVWRNGTYIREISLPFIPQTYPLADIFWVCDDDNQVKAVLPRNWKGLCAPVMLTGQMTVITATSNAPERTKRQLVVRWKKDDKLYIAWNQEPVGVPNKHIAISEGWIKSGQAVGWIPLIGPIQNSQYVARNSRWVKYLWYNQQRIMNWTIAAMEGIRERLHATSLMAMQNRFALDTVLAAEHGVYSYFGDECCTVNPVHTGEDGNLTEVLRQLKTVRDEHVKNTNWNTKPHVLEKIWNWLSTLSWSRILSIIGMVLGAVLLLALITVCVIFPLIRLMVKQATKALTGQFPVVVQTSVAMTDARPLYSDDGISQDSISEMI